jgi:hypothetical protein
LQISLTLAKTGTDKNIIASNIAKLISDGKNN